MVKYVKKELLADMNIQFPDIEKFVQQSSLDKSYEVALKSLKVLLEGTGAGNDFLGWIDLPEVMLDKKYVEITEAADRFRKYEAVLIIGIGGSYLGAKALIEALRSPFKKHGPEILFAGQNLSADYHSELMEYLKEKDFGIIVISKSGTTTEPAIAFRIYYDLLRQKYNQKDIRQRVIAITDAKKGALREFVKKENIKSFDIDDNIGGRFSVLSPVGLLPVSIAGFDIKKLLEGAKDIKKEVTKVSKDNPAVKYAGTRILLYATGKKIELLVNYEPALNDIAEWWKQLFGESEGKNNKGIFPVSAAFTTDLHSLGQYIQQGERLLFETVLFIAQSKNKSEIPFFENDNDGLNYLAGKDMQFVNRKAAEGTLKAHIDGNVPNIWIEISEINEYNLGQLVYFFEISCGISAYIMDVNPFDQPGVEEYKKNMFKLLGKPEK